MKTLYVTDLDGTLLDSNRRLSDFSIETINELIKRGMYFTYATARSLLSASNVTRGIITDLPVITFNGTFISNPQTGEKLLSHYFTEDQKKIIMDSLDNFSVFPLVYSYINNEEKVSWIKDRENEGIKNYLNLRKGDKRLRPVLSKDELYEGELYTFICIGEKEELIDVYEFLQGTGEFTSYFDRELYTEDYWCEVMPKNASKGNAAKTLKEMLNCDRIISFGDAINDISMFEASEESYAVENAAEELKKYAAGIIKSNDDNGVAHWLKANYSLQ